MNDTLFQILEMVILAVVQGIGEFLPISSSGHILVITELFSRMDGNLSEEGLLVSIMLHLGTLCSVFVVFWRRILALLTEDRRVIPLLIIGTIPIVVVGLPLEKFFPGLMESPLLAGFCFIGTACLLLFSDHRQKSETGERLYRDLTVRDALFVGAFQAIAILPGFSRSGFTIVGALLCKLRRDEAATFSFLLSIPAIMGAGIYETIKLVRKAYSPEPEPIEGFWLIFAGAVLSFIVGIIALKWLMAWLQKGRLHYFAYWLLILGPFMIVLMLCFPLASKTNGENGAEPTPVQQIEQNTPTESSEETEEPESSAENTETTEPVASTKPEHVQTIIAHLENDSLNESKEKSDDARPDSFWKSETTPPPIEDEEEEESVDDFPVYVEPPKLTIDDVIGYKKEELVQMDVEDPIWITTDKKQLIILGRICLREGVLELFACARGSKEHESVISIDVKPLFIHAGLLAIGAEPGRPARFDPEFLPPEGDEIEILVRWKLKDGGVKEVRAQELVAKIEYGEDGIIWNPKEGEHESKEMSTPFVFTGSFFREFENDDGEGKTNYYMADITGELFSVSNFPTSILDVPIKSSDSNESLLFRPFTQRIPALDTPVTLVLSPKKQPTPETP